MLTNSAPFPSLTHLSRAGGTRESLATLRRLWRLGGVITVLATAALEAGWRLVFTRAANRAMVRATWLQRTCGRLLRVMRVEADFVGTPPEAGLLVSNHLSYLDIVVLGARVPMAFVSKRDVRSWPGIGWLTTLAGTIYIQREQRSDVARVGRGIRERLAEGGVVCLFPEGTSTDGDEVLPFRSSLLQPAAERGCPVTPAHIRYRLPHGSVAHEVCYWGEMSFGPHFWNLLGKREIQACVKFGPFLRPCADRKELAHELRQRVQQLAENTTVREMHCEV